MELSKMADILIKYDMLGRNVIYSLSLLYKTAIRHVLWLVYAHFIAILILFIASAALS